VTGGGRLDDGGLQGPAATVFVSDPTAEAERVSQALRGAGYTVVDVPLSMLVARVAVQHPRLILIDADSEGALEVVARMRELPDAEAIDILFLARPGGAVATPEEAMAHEGSGLFVRPVEVAALVRKVEVLTGGVGAQESFPSVPPSIPSSSRKRPSTPPSLPPASMRVGEPRSAPLRPPSTRPSRIPSEPPTSGLGRRVAGLTQPVSPELQQLLSAAEKRVQSESDPDSVVPSPEDEIEAVLPAELLAALDEPLEDDEDDDEVVLPARSLRSSAGVREPTNDGGGPRTTGATGQVSTPTTGNTPRAPAVRPVAGDAGLTPAPPHTHSGTHSGHTGSGASTTGSSEPRPRPDVSVPERQPSIAPPTAWSPVGHGEPDLELPKEPEAPLRDELFDVRELSAGRPPAPELPAVADEPFSLVPAVIGPGEVSRVIGQAIAARRSGSLCLATAEAERRLVLREGDVVTLASTAEDESLLAFLGVRGDLPKETVRRLASKFPPFGRHAGAALVARGYLRQDQLWPTLRAHAEWLLARLLQVTSARLVLEAQPPGRLAGEPGVFGGSTGAEVFVDVVRRVVTPANALERLGGSSSRVSQGPQARLLGECALGSAELDHVTTLSGRSLREVLEAAPEGDLATVIFALSELGVVEVMAAVGRSEDGNEPGAVAGVAELDAEAIRARVRARMQLVDDGDYFALLGVPHEATGYEVRRAFLELRRAFDPARVLTPEIADLADDVRKIVVVLEEAYDILKDAARRDRYRRAIEGAPA
jgi:hypothetical protein